MQTNEITSERLRRLAGLRPGRPVLTLYLNLDPSSFGTPPARAAAIRSLLDEAHRRVKEAGDALSHEERAGLDADLERVARFFSGEFDAKGAHAVAVFSSSGADVFEALKLPRPVASQVVIDDSPFVEPLAELGDGGNWCVMLVNRRTARIFRGSREGLREVTTFTDEVHGQHEQGGWSQANYQRSVEKEAEDHVKHAAEVLFRRHKARPCEHLLIGCAQALLPEVEAKLHPYLRERLVGRLDVDVEHSSAEDVLRAAAPMMDEAEERAAREAIERLEQGLGSGGRAAAGLDEVLGVLNERRVEVLLMEEGFSADGVVCPRDGWLGVAEERCPIDGADVQPRENIAENAVETAIGQSAQVRVVRRDDGGESALTPHGGIAALLRF